MTNKTTNTDIQISDLCKSRNILSKPIWNYFFFLAIFNVHVLGNRNALKGLGVGISLAILSQLTANFALMSYAVMVFNKFGTSMDSNKSAYVMALSMIFGSLTNTYLSDSLGRKMTNFISFSGSAIGLFTASAYYYINLNCMDLSTYEFVPVVSLSFVIFISSAGILPLVFICTVEYMPKKVITFNFVNNLSTFFHRLWLSFLTDSNGWRHNNIDCTFYCCFCIS